MDTYDVGTQVKWKWGTGWASGEVQRCFTDEITRTIDGTEVKRNASDDNPAYLVEQDDGSRALKSHSELQKA